MVAQLSMRKLHCNSVCNSYNATQFATVALLLDMQQLHCNSICINCIATEYATVAMQVATHLHQQFLLEYFIVSLLLFDARFKRFQISDWLTYQNEANSKTLTEIYKEIKGYKVRLLTLQMLETFIGFNNGFISSWGRFLSLVSFLRLGSFSGILSLNPFP